MITKIWKEKITKERKEIIAASGKGSCYNQELSKYETSVIDKKHRKSSLKIFFLKECDDKSRNESDTTWKREKNQPILCYSFSKALKVPQPLNTNVTFI